MTRTRPGLLVLLAVASAVGAALLQLGLGVSGAVKLVPQLTLAVTLVVIAAAVIAAAWPVRRASRADKPDAPRTRVDPFYATRVVLIAKASAVAAAIFGGAAVGIVGELLMRPIAAPGGLWAGFAMVVGAVVLLVAALIAEGWCMVPPGGDEPPDADAATS